MMILILQISDLSVRIFYLAENFLCTVMLPQDQLKLWHAVQKLKKTNVIERDHTT